MDGDPISLLVKVVIEIFRRSVILIRMSAILFGTYLEKRVVEQCRDRPIESRPALQYPNPPYQCIADVLMEKSIPEILIVRVCYSL